MELLAVIFSLFSVILTVKNSKYCWPVGIIGIIFYTIIFFQTGLMGNFILQFLFVVQSLLGWYNWNKKDATKIDWLQNRLKLLFLPVLYAIVVIFTIKSGSTLPYLDSITTTLSITAMFLIAYRKIEGWLFWIAVDSVSIYMFYILGLYLSSFIYFIFLILATSGLIKWIKNYEKEV